MDPQPQLDYQRIQRDGLRREKVAPGYWRVWIGEQLLADGVSAARARLIAMALRLVLR